MIKRLSLLRSLSVATSATFFALPTFAEDLTLVLNRNTSNLAGFIASDLDLFRKHGADVGIVIAGTGSESNEMLATGRVDGGTLGLGPTVIAWANGFDFVPVVKYRDGAEVYSIVVRKDAGISEVSDLKGKRVAVTKGTDPETAFILALRAHGITYSDVQILDAKWADHAALLDRGDVDAVNANEPFGSLIVQSMSEKAELLERLGPYYGNGGFVLINRKAMEDKPDAVKAVVLAYWEAHEIIRENPDIAIESIKKWLQLDDDIANETINLFGARPLLTEKTIADLRINAELLHEGNKIRAIPDIDSPMADGMTYQEELRSNPDYTQYLE